MAELARDYAPKIYQLALRYLKNHEDAEEITQDVLLKAYEKIDDFRGDAALSSWLFRIAFNAAMSRLRHLKLARAAERPQEDVPSEAMAAGIPRRPDAADRGALADEALFRRQLRDRLTRAVKDLPAIYRAPVILRDLHGLSTEEASTALRLNDQTLKSRLHRGRLMLRQKLSEFSGGLTLRYS